jgi:hypothetical protein
MKTKNVILIGALLGLGYVMYKNSKTKASANSSTTDDTSGGSVGGSSAPGGYEGLSYHPIIPGMSNPTPGPIEVVVVPLPPKPIKTKVVIDNLQQVKDLELAPSVSTSPPIVGITPSEPLIKNNDEKLYLKK